MTLVKINWTAEVIHKTIALVAQTKDETLDAEGGVATHDVPDDGLFADRHHRFGKQFSHVAQTRAFAAAQDHERGHIRGRDRFGETRYMHKKKISKKANGKNTHFTAHLKKTRCLKINDTEKASVLGSGFLGCLINGGTKKGGDGDVTGKWSDVS